MKSRIEPEPASPHRTFPRHGAMALLLLALALWLWRASAKPAAPDAAADPEGRVARARARCGAIIAGYFRTAGISYPPREVFLRAFKHEAVVEAWARNEDGAFQMIRSYPVTHTSGKPGPKRREGDRQVPEGFYFIDAFNPRSIFHLSLRVNYPNDSDRIFSDREKPGFDIYVHGGAKSVGCLPLGDPGIEEIYLMCLDAGNRGQLPIHIFPARMSGASWAKFVAPYRVSDPALVQFWENLQPGFDAFERERQVPKITIGKDGRYGVEP